MRKSIRNRSAIIGGTKSVDMAESIPHVVRMMTLRENLVRVGDVYCAAKGIGRKRLSTVALNRGSTMDRLASGESDVTTGTYERAMMWLSENWPDDAEWPCEVPRPAARQQAEAS